MIDEHANWGYLWSNQMQWKHQFVAVSPGKIQVFSSQARDHLEKKFVLNGATTVKIVESGEPGNAPLAKSSKLHFWRRISRGNSCANQYLPEPEGAIVIVNSAQGKKLFLLVSTQYEAEVWKMAIEHRILPQKRKSLLLRVLSLSSSSSSLSDSSSSKEKSVRDASFQTRAPTPRCEASGSEVICDALDTRDDCTAFLKARCSNWNAFEIAMLMIDQFNGFYQMGDCQLPNELRIEAWKGTLVSIVRALRDQVLAGNCGTDTPRESDMENLWLACETWVMAAAHNKIMGACEQMFAADDRKLALTLSKIRQLDPSVLGVTADLRDLAFGEALQVFGMINMYRTPLEKAGCLRKTINCVLDGMNSAQNQEKLCTTDDLLSLMVLLMAHAKVQHLQATSCYMENFFQLLDEHQSGELRYHVTNFVAACAFLASPQIEELVSNVVISPASASSSSPGSSTSSSSRRGRLSRADVTTERDLKEIDAAFARGTSESSPEFILAPTYL